MNKSTFCPLPWIGLHTTPEMDTYFCCLSATPDGKNSIGNLRKKSLRELLKSPAAQDIQKAFKKGQWPKQCCFCSEMPQGERRSEIFCRDFADAKTTPSKSTLPKLRNVDLRIRNTCKMGCIYCGPASSSFWAKVHKNEQEHFTPTAFKKLLSSFEFDSKKSCFLNLSGGEPLLIAENVALLKKLKKEAPHAYIFVNTGLNYIDTEVFELLRTFKNVRWIVSADDTEARYEFIRFGANWQQFIKNLRIIKSFEPYGHIVFIHSVFFALNSLSFFKALQTFTDLGISKDFITVDPVYYDALDARNLPDHWLQQIIRKIDEGMRLKTFPSSGAGLIHRLQQPHEKRPQDLVSYLKDLDKARNLDSRSIFPEIIDLIE